MIYMNIFASYIVRNFPTYIYIESTDSIIESVDSINRDGWARFSKDAIHYKRGNISR